METYDPTSESTPITMIPELPEISEEEKKKGVPTGLLRPEKKVDDDQMADFSTPIDDLMGSPGQMPEMMGPPPPLTPSSVIVPRPAKKKAASQSANPFGLTDAQFLAALAGVAATIAYSAPIQSRLSTMVPKFLLESGKHSITGMVVSAVVAAVVFYFARKFITEKA